MLEVHIRSPVADTFSDVDNYLTGAFFARIISWQCQAASKSMNTSTSIFMERFKPMTSMACGSDPTDYTSPKPTRVLGSTC